MPALRVCVLGAGSSGLAGAEALHEPVRPLVDQVMRKEPYASARTV